MYGRLSTLSHEVETTFLSIIQENKRKTLAIWVKRQVPQTTQVPKIGKRSPSYISTHLRVTGKTICHPSKSRPVLNVVKRYKI